MDINLKDIGAQLSGQFQGLAGRHPGLWPLAPRVLCGASAMAAVIALGWFGYWSSQFEEYDQLAQQEVSLRDAYKSKMSQAINLEALQAQKVQVDQYVERLQKQLPSKAEMAALLTDINQAGLGRGLQFELFKPGNVVVRDYYAEQAIDLKVSGNYHDIGAFAADMANLQRIVTLNNMSLTAGKDGVLMLDAVAKTFRYLDPDEANAQRKARAEKQKLAKGAAK
jgi:type IV pilus assembly protein PilO